MKVLVGEQLEETLNIESWVNLMDEVNQLKSITIGRI